MRFPRRRLLQILSVTFGPNFVFDSNHFGIAERGAIQPTLTAPPDQAAVNSGPAAGPPMEKVTGIGGLFFRAHDPAALGRWYQQHLGISVIPTSYQESPWQQEAGPTA